MMTITRTPFAHSDQAVLACPTPSNDNRANAVRYRHDQRDEIALPASGPVDFDRRIVGKIGLACVGLVGAAGGMAVAVGLARLIGWAV